MKRLCTLLLVVVTTSADTGFDFDRTNAKFSGSVYKSFAKNAPKNFVLSPFSTEALLSLTESGCKDPTAREIRYALYSRESSALKSAIKNVLFSLATENLGYMIDIANKIYVQNDFPVRNDFRRTATDTYRAECENIDFSRQYEAAETINNWVQNKTNNKIRHLLETSSLNDRSKVVLVNAIYFKANWLKPFPVAYTKKLEFHLSPENIVKVDTMILHEKEFYYFESSDMRSRFLEIPFKGQDASMVIVLPDEIDGLPFVETQLKKILKSRRFNKRLVTLTLPRFKIETSVDLVPILKNIGVTRIFDPKMSDMSGIAGQKSDLFVEKIAQKAFIDVSEEGVEAAAANYHLLAVPMSAPPEQPIKFRVDRPFIFYVKVKGVVLFVGRVIDPQI